MYVARNGCHCYTLFSGIIHIYHSYIGRGLQFLSDHFWMGDEYVKEVYEGHSENIRTFCSFLKSLNIFLVPFQSTVDSRYLDIAYLE